MRKETQNTKKLHKKIENFMALLTVLNGKC